MPSKITELIPEKQSYAACRQICRATGQLFEDPLFKPPPGIGERWLRPREICQSPKFIADGISRFDVQQGALGDCWMVAAMANLTLDRKLFDRVVPTDQTFDEDSYCGLFRFNFWRNGKWIEIVIDDRLPVEPDNNRPCYVHSSDRSEFWSPLLEKAYAKLNGSYKAIEGGDFCEAMVDFTGGLAERFDLRKLNFSRQHLFRLLKKAIERGSMIGCSIRSRDIRHKMNGLVEYHAYSVTGLLEVHDGESLVPILRIRNPWGNHKEWTGLWSDHSYKWSNISASERARIGLNVSDDGEFWMSLDDWFQNFTHCEVCHLSAECVESSVKHSWCTNMMEGSWSWNVSAGGHLMPGNLAEFVKNPQFFLKLTQADLDDPAGNCTLVVALMQAHYRSADVTPHSVAVGFYVYAVEDKYYTLAPGTKRPQHLGAEFFFKHTPIETRPYFTYDNDLSARFHLRPGTYVIIPTTEAANEEGQFLLRVYTEHLVRCVESCRSKVSDTPSFGSRMPCSLGDIYLRQSTLKPQLVNAKPGSKVDQDDDPEIRYPTLHYEGQPKIVSNRVNVGPSRRARTQIRVSSPETSQDSKPKRRSFIRRLLSLGKSAAKHKQRPHLSL